MRLIIFLFFLSILSLPAKRKLPELNETTKVPEKLQKTEIQYTANECIICKEKITSEIGIVVFTNNNTRMCRHFLCKTCAQTMITDNRPRSCPMDRIPFTDYKMVNKNNRQEVFTLMDVDGDKRLNRTDVELALPILMPDLPVNAIDMFPRWDRDGDEYLDGDEYQRFMDDMPPEAFPLPELDQTFVVVRDPEQTATLLEHLTSIGMILLVHDNLTIAQRVLLIDDLLGIVSVPELNATVSFSNLNAEDLERIRGAGEAIELGQGDFERMGDAIGINVRQGDEEEG